MTRWRIIFFNGVKQNCKLPVVSQLVKPNDAGRKESRCVSLCVYACECVGEYVWVYVRPIRSID